MLLSGKHDVYGGVVVHGPAFEEFEPESGCKAFSQQLVASLTAWREQNKRGIWLEVPLRRAHLVSVALDNGFRVHHASDAYIMLTLWLPEDEASTLPEYASHFIGVGGLVINDSNEVLLVEEKFVPPHIMEKLKANAGGTTPRLWKLPGGLVSAGESIADAVEREVYEETGVRCKFQSTVAFRETLKYRYGKSDIYIINRCRPVSQSREISIQESEIKSATWMPMEQYLRECTWSNMNHRVMSCAADMYCPEFVREMCDSNFGSSAPLYHGESSKALSADSRNSGVGAAQLLAAFAAGALLSRLICRL